ncbi:glycosyltransferase family 4 protein [Limobrevibacterium gyesilva]|uniref:Glycosyltransferase family 4 protein n=1 Tax=Limobrevibacterium gyesilva TaxID=2991712 RepID=A0AA42CCQ9_9PROT|nr:glycosyltransferase family 4 protein [Limobrevibacterium gyesilva]MCW3473793.1 glycosyltransferase family 4 protein [Limobrevibacterium gyesilva]
MNLVFIHQNMPGQFHHVIGALAATGAHRIVCIGRPTDFAAPGIGRITYQPPDAARLSGHPFLRPAEAAVMCGQQVAYFLDRLARNGFRPDLVVAHPGWGESLYVKDVYADVPLLHYCEFYYRSHGADTNFDPADQQDLTADSGTRTRNAHLLLALDACDWGISPTQWQKRLHPPGFQSRISVVFDGVDAAVAKPDLSATFTLPDGRVLAAGDEVVTYAARNLEPHRGFPSFMRAVPVILRRRPGAQVVVAGGDDVSYGRPPPSGGTWRAALLSELDVDPSRVHFVGHLPYERYLRLLQVSAAHVYLTVPFVLSWSMIEAMAAGCLVIGSATPPVQEVIEDGRNGWLVDFFAPGAIAERVADALANGRAATKLREAARATVLARYALAVCLPRQIAVMQDVAAGRRPD